MKCVWLALVFLGLVAQNAQAGPWLREKGKTFSASSFTINYSLESGNTTYLEHGLTEKTTIGVDFGQFRTHSALATGYTTVFMRRSLVDQERSFKLAYEVGIGSGWVGDTLIPHVKTGLSYGRGLSYGDKSGWLAIDSAVNWNLYNGRHVTKVDTTLGLNFNEKWAGMFQVYVAHVDGDVFTTLAPSVVLSPRNSKFQFQVGMESPWGDAQNTSLKLGVWSEF